MDDMGRLSDRVAIVTGGAQGIGEAICRRLAEDGATVVVADINGEGAEAVAADIGGSAISFQVDVGDEDGVAVLFAKVQEDFGKLDVLVNNAAIVPFTAWDDVDYAEWRRIQRVNLDGVFLMSRGAYEAMKDQGKGRIINMCSNSFFAGTPNMAAYVASKGGVLGLTRAMATEVGGYGITVNAVCPGLIDTEMVRTTITDERMDAYANSFPIPRLGNPEEVADLVAFLASDQAAYITGASLDINGGDLMI